MALNLTLNGKSATEDRAAVHAFIDKAFNGADKMIADLVAEATSADQAAGSYQQIATDMANLATARAKRIAELEADLARETHRADYWRNAAGANNEACLREHKARRDDLEARDERISKLEDELRRNQALVDILGRKVEELRAELEKATAVDALKFVAGCPFSAHLCWSQGDNWQLAIKVDRELSDDDGVNEYDGSFAYVLSTLVDVAARFNSDLA